jgi:transposase
VTTAPTTPPPIEGARPGPGMLAQLVTSKNSDAVPLERQSKILARGGAPIAPSTLGDWYAGAADLALPLWKALREDTLGRYLISVDDTGLAVRDRGHARGIKRGHIWRISRINGCFRSATGERSTRRAVGGGSPDACRYRLRYRI